MKKKYTPFLHWAIPERNLTWWLEDMESPGGYQKNSIWNFQG